MKKFKFTKENIALFLIVILSAILNFANNSIEGTANSYYAAAVKSMTLSWKNFFFVSFDPAGFVTIDKPPLGFWFQAVSAKIFGFSGWSILLPEALAGVLSVIIIYKIVKRSFGPAAGLISSLVLSVTPVFVADCRNNTCDNILILFLLLACWALSIAAEKGKFKYLIFSMIFVGLGFNVKMLQAYMIAPALYITYLLSTAVSIKKKIIHLVVATFVLLSVSLSWSIIVDLVPASSRPYIDSSTNNTVMELIVGHNGLERLGLSSSSSGGSGQGGGQMPGGEMPSSQMQNGEMPTPPSGTADSQSSSSQPSANVESTGNSTSNSNDGGMRGNPPSGNPGMQGNPGSHGMQGAGGNSKLQGTFGAEVSAGLSRLFVKSMLSDQIVWFIPLAILGFIIAAIKEKLRFFLDNKRKQSLVLWAMWFLPVFLYFSYTTGTFHTYYLTMLAPPIAALTGIGLTAMWKFYKEGTWKSWFLPVSLLVNGAVQLLMLYYFIDYSYIVKILMVLLIVLCFGSSIILSILNLTNKKRDIEEFSKSKTIKFKKTLVSLAMVGLLLTPLVGSAATIFHSVGSLPAAGLELLSGTQSGMNKMGGDGQVDSGLVSFLLANKTENQKYLLVVSNSNNGANIIIQTGEAVMSLGGFLGNNNAITLDEFITMVKNGEIRYVMTGGQGGGNGSNNEIMTWVKENGTAVSSSEYSSTSSSQGQKCGGESGSLYDLKAYTDKYSTN